MTYKHTLVSDVLTSTIQSGNDAKLNDIETLLDDDAATRKLVRTRVGARMHLHYPNDPYVLGYVDWSDPYDGGDGSKRYSVHSPNIRNMRYTSGRDAHYQQVTENPKKVVKIIKESVRPHTLHDLCHITMRSVGYKVASVFDDANEETNRIAGEIFGRNDTPSRAQSLMKEIKHLLNTEHKFLDVGLKAKFVDYFAAKEEGDELRSEVTDYLTTFVYVRDRLGKQVYDTIQIKMMHNYKRATVDGSEMTYNDDTLPADLQGKLAVISTLPIDQFTDGVGIRTQERMFYVIT